jgi:hypothetical protein
MNKLNLVLHCGGQITNREDITKVATPDPIETWYPISHTTLINTVERELNNLNMHIENESYALANDGKRMFGLLQVSNGHNSDDYSWVMGVRNSHDKKFPAGLCVGSGVFVCDNTAFSSEIVIGRKHTLNISRDLPMLVTRVCGELAAKWDTQGKRIEAYKTTELTNPQAAWMILNAMRQNVFPKTHINEILEEWLKPSYPEFQDRNVWALFNAVTKQLRDRNADTKNAIWDLPARTTRLHAICDGACGFDISDLKAVEVTEVN